MQYLELSDLEHGSHCECRMLAAATGVEPSVVTFNYCQLVLRKRWGIRCNHGQRALGKRVTPVLPARDPDDAVQAILVANARESSD